jgi:hypothetical protein
MTEYDEFLDDDAPEETPDWFSQYLPEAPAAPAIEFRPSDSPGGGYGAASNIDPATRDGRDTAPPPAFPGRFGDGGSYDPYATGFADGLNANSPEGRAASLMDSAIGQTRGRIESASQLDQDRVIDWERPGIDQSGEGAPIQRVYSVTGKVLGIGDPIGSYDDLRSVTGYAKDPDGNRYDLPGFDGRSRFGTGMRPDRLEDGRQVHYDQFNNLTYADNNGRPGDLLVGGLGYQGGRKSVVGYNVNPEVDRFGRDVWHERGSGRTFLRGKDDSMGARIDPNVGPARAAGPAGPGRGPGGDPPSVKPGTELWHDTWNGIQFITQADGTVQAFKNGQPFQAPMSPAQAQTIISQGKAGQQQKIQALQNAPDQMTEQDVLRMNQGAAPSSPATGVPPAPPSGNSVTTAPVQVGPGPNSGPVQQPLQNGQQTPGTYRGPDGRTYGSQAEFEARYGMSPDAYQRHLDYAADQRRKGVYSVQPPRPVR